MDPLINREISSSWPDHLIGCDEEKSAKFLNEKVRVDRVNLLVYFNVPCTKRVIMLGQLKVIPKNLPIPGNGSRDWRPARA